MRIGDARLAIALAILGGAAYLAFGWGTETARDEDGRLASALLGGRWWLDAAPAHLGELIPCGPQRWCVAGPPLPALLSLPFVATGSPGLAQSLMARVAGGASAGPLYLGLRAFGAPRLVALAGTLVSALGTSLLFSSADGRSTYAAHSVAVLFGSVAFWLAARGGPDLGIGAAIALASLARPPFAAATPALALLSSRRAGGPYLRALGLIVAASVPVVALYAGYDLLRWGSVLDLGYVRLAEGDVFFPYGPVSPLYLPRHLYALFLQPPDLIEGSLYFLRPRFVGMSLFFAAPAFLWVFAGLRRARRDRAVAAAALAAVSALVPSLLGGATGGPQLGYRFALDAQPFLVALALAGDAAPSGVWRRSPSMLFLVASVFAAAVNAYAGVAILRFGYWQ